jgi:hypothetical protein
MPCLPFSSNLSLLKLIDKARHRWLMPVILATQEAEFPRMAV